MRVSKVAVMSGRVWSPRSNGAAKIGEVTKRQPSELVTMEIIALVANCCFSGVGMMEG
jgi:hypothetical protein